MKQISRLPRILAATCLMAAAAVLADLPLNAPDYKICAQTPVGDMPLGVVDEAKLNIGTLMDYASIDAAFELVNRSEKDVTVSKVFVRCPCLKLKDTIENMVLKPGEKITVNYTLNGRLLTDEKISRFIFAELSDRFGYVDVTGTLKQTVDYTPAQIISLGAVNIDTPWKRSWTIKINLDQKIEKLVPSNSKSMNTSVKSLGDNTFQIDISPKLPIKFGNVIYWEKFAVEGIENYGPITLGIKCKGEKLPLRTAENTMLLAKNGQEDIPFSFKIMGPALKKALPKPPTMIKTHEHEDIMTKGRSTAESPVDVAENSKDYWSETTWKNLAPHITLKPVKGLTYDKKIERDGIVFTGKLTQEAIKGKNRLRLEYHYMGMKTGTVLFLLK